MGGFIKKVKGSIAMMLCFSLLAASVTLMGGGLTAKAQSNGVIMQTIYKDGDTATLVVKVVPSLYNEYGVRLLCQNSTYGLAYDIGAGGTGLVRYVDGNTAYAEYEGNENVYVITYTIKKSTIPSASRAYFYSGTTCADNGGYGYYIFE